MYRGDRRFRESFIVYGGRLAFVVWPEAGDAGERCGPALARILEEGPERGPLSFPAALDAALQFDDAAAARGLWIAVSVHGAVLHGNSGTRAFRAMAAHAESLRGAVEGSGSPEATTQRAREAWLKVLRWRRDEASIEEVLREARSEDAAVRSAALEALCAWSGRSPSDAARVEGEVRDFDDARWRREVAGASPSPMEGAPPEEPAPGVYLDGASPR